MKFFGLWGLRNSIKTAKKYLQNVIWGIFIAEVSFLFGLHYVSRRLIRIYHVKALKLLRLYWASSCVYMFWFDWFSSRIVFKLGNFFHHFFILPKCFQSAHFKWKYARLFQGQKCFCRMNVSHWMIDFYNLRSSWPSRPHLIFWRFIHLKLPELGSQGSPSMGHRWTIAFPSMAHRWSADLFAMAHRWASMGLFWAPIDELSLFLPGYKKHLSKGLLWKNIGNK